MSFIIDAYKRFLWVIGFPQGLTISECLAWQKVRLGSGWWAMVIITILFILISLAFAIWLAYHVATFRLKGR